MITKRRLRSKKLVLLLMLLVTSLMFAGGGLNDNNVSFKKAPQVLFGWDFSSLSGGVKNYGPSSYAPSYSNANIEVSGLVRGAGILTDQYSGISRGLGGFPWFSNSKAEAIANQDYFSFSVKVKSDYRLHLSGISVFAYKRVGFRPQKGVLQYSINNGVSYVDIQNFTYGYGGELPAINLSSIGYLQNLQSETKVLFRIVNWGGIAGQAGVGSWYFYDQNNSTDLDFAFTGEVESLPKFLFGWDFSTLKGGSKNFGPSPYPATYVDSNLNVSGIVRGAGVLTNQYSGVAKGLGGFPWLSNTMAEAISNQDFFTFSVNPKVNYKLELTSLSVFGYKRIGFRPQKGMLQYSKDNGANFTDIKALTYGYGGYIQPIDLMNTPALQAIYHDEKVIFRIVNWGGIAGQTGIGSWYFFDQNNSQELDFAFTGTVKPDSVVWDGQQWSNSVGPDASLSAILEGAYYENKDFICRDLYVTKGSLAIQPGHSVTVYRGIFQNTDYQIKVESDANLIQTSLANTNDGKKIKVKRHAYVPATEYTYWSSPVVGQNWYDLYAGIPAGRVLKYNTVNDAFVTVPASSAISEVGKGYSIKGSTGLPASLVGTFSGIPNNSNLQTVVSNVGNRYNLIGNPYPSNINLDVWYQANRSNLDPSSDGNTAFFWDNTNNAIYTQMGSSYTGLNYAVYNFASRTGVAAPQADSAAKVPTNILKLGQGFIVMVAPSASFIDFSNSQRSISQNSIFFREAQLNRYWLQLTSPKGLRLSTALVYDEEATNNFDPLDSEIPNPNASDLLYTKSDDRVRLTIQARSYFDIKERISLGLKAFVAGSYTISLADREGLFNKQSIYLLDKKLNTLTDLSTASYSFTESKGVVDSRFEILYTDDFKVIKPFDLIKDEAIGYYINQDYIVKSKTKLTRIEVYDMMGELKEVQDLNTNDAKIDISFYNSGIYIVKIFANNGTIVSRFIRK